MKTKILYLLAFTLALFLWSCNKSEVIKTPQVQVSLKSSLTQGVQALTTAVNAITTSAGYQVVAGPSDLLTKSVVQSPRDTITHSILLADIGGVYEYKATTYKRNHMSVMRFFNKTADSSLMVVRLPEEKVQKSKRLLSFWKEDTLLTNNYQITLSDYQYRFSHSKGWTYQLASSTKISDVEAGTLKIQSSKNRTTGYHFASEYDFPNGYITKCSYTPGDTAISVYAISDGTKTLYEEKYTSIRTDSLSRHREKEFSLTIGDVRIVRQLGHGQASLDSAKVYVGDVLQLKSKVEIVDTATGAADTDPTDHCINNHKRELKITFDDGTSSTFTELAGTVIDNIGSLFASLRQAYFGTAIIDWIAWDVYINK